jgi:hypothetical protein
MMNDLTAMTLERFPVNGLRHVRDLIDFDGPLLSLFRHPNGESYLYYWCDCDETANRWMVLRVAEATVIRLTNRIIPLSDVIPSGSRDDYIYFLDIASDDSTKAYLVIPANVPDSYKPVAGELLEPQEGIEDSHSYSFLLQGEWSVEAIGDFPKTFNKIYSVIYGMNILHTAGYTTHPWRGGFSSMHFFHEAMSEVPRGDRPYIDAIQKSSPGFIRFSLNMRTAEQAVQCVVDFKSKEWAITDEATTLRRYIRRHGLNDIESSDSPTWEPFNKRLVPLAQHLLSYFDAIDENQFMKMCPRPFEASKIALTFVKYVQDLVNFERQGLVEFPKQKPSARTS